MNGHYEYEIAAFVSARMLVGQFLAEEYLKQMKNKHAKWVCCYMLHVAS